ncbi:MSHA biogenesis protein MshP [Duganella sp. SG902]|uniref:agglutinin biogenesis protein MshP n=1 Tax=Duganella sp. SG902 TaxID=2587016 RepID=UPI00159E05FF|nr:agglutinin biogenesis protein MshP [Duganella sp. SG902]NVM78524.1 MSHA biogenesis protein MshP [Duganella sp. SG902]
MSAVPYQRRRSHGVAMLTAIFLLVVVAGLGVAVVTLTTTQQAGSAMDVQGQRAYQAARAGIEWGLYMAQRPVIQNPNDTTVTPVCPATGSFNFPNATTLANFTVTVTCQATGGHLVIRATACNQPDATGSCPNPVRGADYVQRVITAQL